MAINKLGLSGLARAHRRLIRSFGPSLVDFWHRVGCGCMNALRRGHIRLQEEEEEKRQSKKEGGRPGPFVRCSVIITHIRKRTWRGRGYWESEGKGIQIKYWCYRLMQTYVNFGVMPCCSATLPIKPDLEMRIAELIKAQQNQNGSLNPPYSYPVYTRALSRLICILNWWSSTYLFFVRSFSRFRHSNSFSDTCPLCWCFLLKGWPIRVPYWLNRIQYCQIGGEAPALTSWKAFERWRRRQRPRGRGGRRTIGQSARAPAPLSSSSSTSVSPLSSSLAHLKPFALIWNSRFLKQH